MNSFNLPGVRPIDASGEAAEAPRGSRLPHIAAGVGPEDEDHNNQESRYYQRAAGTHQGQVYDNPVPQEYHYQNNVATGQSRVHYGHFFGRDITINNTYSSQFTKEAYTQCLDSLKPVARNPRLQTVETAHEESFHWIWEEGVGNPGFASWARAGNGFYWVSGKPGAGKSTIMKYMYKNFEERIIHSLPALPKIIQAGYFFHELGIPQEQTFHGFLAATLYQLLLKCKELSPVVLPIFKRERDLAGDEVAFTWTEETLKEALWAISRQQAVEATAYLFVDGLDECESDIVRRDQLDRFLVPWVESMKDTPLSIRVCLASRRLQEIELYLARWPGVRIHERTAKDIFNYVNSTLHRTTERLAHKHRNQHFRQQLRDRLIQSIVEKSEGVFLWVKLVLKEIIFGLEAGNSDAELQNQIDNLPTDIRNLYAKILKDIKPQYWAGTWLYTQMLCHLIGTHKLSLLEISFAEDSLETISQHQYAAYLEEHSLQERCDRTRDRIQSRCGVLLEIVLDTVPCRQCHAIHSAKDVEDGCDVNNEYIFFVHRSVMEYLEEPSTASELSGRISKGQELDVNVALMKGCLGYLIADWGSWPPWRPLTVLGDVEGIWPQHLPYFFEYLGTLDECTQYPTAPYIEVLDKIYTECSKAWHDHYCYLWGRESLTSKAELQRRRERSPLMDIVALAIVHGHSRYVVTKLKVETWTMDRKIALLLCAIDSTKYEKNSLEILSALLEAHTFIDKEIFAPWTPWGHVLVNFWRTRTCSLKRWFDIFQLFLKYGADPNYHLPRSPQPRTTSISSGWPSPDFSDDSLSITKSSSPTDWLAGISASSSQPPSPIILEARPTMLSATILPVPTLSFLPPPQEGFSPQNEKPFGALESKFVTPLRVIVDRSASARKLKDLSELAEYKALVELLFSYGADPMLPDSNGEIFNAQIEEILDFRSADDYGYRQILIRPEQVRIREYSVRTWGRYSMVPLDSDYYQHPGVFLAAWGGAMMAIPKARYKNYWHQINVMPSSRI